MSALWPYSVLVALVLGCASAEGWAASPYLHGTEDEYVESNRASRQESPYYTVLRKLSRKRLFDWLSFDVPRSDGGPAARALTGVYSGEIRFARRYGSGRVPIDLSQWMSTQDEGLDPQHLGAYLSVGIYDPAQKVWRKISGVWGRYSPPPVSYDVNAREYTIELDRGMFPARGLKCSTVVLSARTAPVDLVRKTRLIAGNVLCDSRKAGTFRLVRAER